MGEAWFMGDERKMFPELCGDLKAISTQNLQEPLEEIASGTSSFGPMREWSTWYHYLLGALLPRSHELHVTYFLESLVTAFMAIYPNGVYRGPYKGFHEDALRTLGRSIMDSECWNGSDIAIGKVLRRSNDNPNQVWVWWDASGDFTASMFFCLKYLPEAEVEPWLRSVLDIPSPHWRGAGHSVVRRGARNLERHGAMAFGVPDGCSPPYWMGMVSLPQAGACHHRRQRLTARGDLHPRGFSCSSARRAPVLLLRRRVPGMARLHFDRSVP